MHTQLLETLAQRQYVNWKMPPTEGRPLSRKMKNDASKTLGKRTKKECDTPRALQVGYKKHMQQPLSEMSHTHMDFFCFVAPPSVRRTQASTDKKCYNYIQKGHLTSQYPLALNCLRNPTLAEISKTTLEDELTM
jgi:hypothetical protein